MSAYIYVGRQSVMVQYSLMACAKAWCSDTPKSDGSRTAADVRWCEALLAVVPWLDTPKPDGLNQII